MADSENELNENQIGGSIEEARARIVDEFQQFERNFKRDHFLSWLLALIGPVVITVAALVVVYFVWGWQLVQSILAYCFATFFLFGRLIILQGHSPEKEIPEWMERFEGYVTLLTAEQLFVVVTYMDFMTALFVAFHMGIVFRIPWVGGKIAGMVGDSQFLIEKVPTIKKISYIALVLFVIFPTSTTGSIGGSILGRLLGLGRWTTVSAILIGSILGNGLMVYLSQRMDQIPLFDKWWVKLGSVLIVVAIFVVVERFYRGLVNKYLNESE